MTAPFPTPDTTGDMTLVIGWRSGTKTKLRRVNMDQSVAADMRAVAVAVAEDIAGRENEAWSPEAASAPEVLLTLATGEVGPTPTLARDIEELSPLLNALRLASALDPMTAENLPAAELQFYALVIGDNVGDRTVWIRLTNARRGLRRGRSFTKLADTLTKVEDPIFGFEDDLDMVAKGGVLGILNQGAFKKLFRDNSDLADQVPSWIASWTEHLAITEDAEQVLVARCRADSRLRMKLESISFRGHLPSVPPARIRTKMHEFGMDASRFFNEHGDLDFLAEDVPDLLKVLNEDIFKGALTDTLFRADRKAFDA